MIQTIKKAWAIPELRKKLVFTALILLIFRIGNAIPVPYVNTDLLGEYLDQLSTTVLGLYNVMSGGAFAEATVFALGVQPYINSSIIIQLLTIAIPALERMARDGGEEGKKKIQSITRYATVAIAILQGWGYYALMKNYGILTNTSVWAALVIIVSFIAGSSFVMWMGEQITEFGIGNGISIILFAGILSRVPSMVSSGHSYIVSNPTKWWAVVLVVLGILALIVLVTWVNGAERRIPVQYAKRVVGRKMYGGQSTYIPMKINSTGVMPLIFGFAILQFPATIFAFFPTSGINVWWQSFQSGIWYQVVLAVLIIAFTYFYTSITFNPVDISKNMQQNGGIIPGIRQGRATSDYLSRVSGRLTLFSALFLAVLATIPTMLTRIFGITAPFGASSVLIAVSVGIETIRQVEAQMVMRHHKGFLG